MNSLCTYPPQSTEDGFDLEHPIPGPPSKKSFCCHNFKQKFSNIHSDNPFLLKVVDEWSKISKKKKGVGDFL